MPCRERQARVAGGDGVPPKVKRNPMMILLPGRKGAARVKGEVARMRYL